MAFGLPAKYIYSYNLGDLDKEHFLVFAIEATTRPELDWDVSSISETGFTAYTKFSMRSWSEEVTVKIEDGVVNIKSECIGPQIMDWGKNKVNIEDLFSEIVDIKKELTETELESKVIELRQKYISTEKNVLSKSQPETKKISGFFSIFKPVKGYFVTPILININILIFIAMIISGVHFLMPDIQSLVDWGANFRPLTLEGQWWRLFSAMFLHIGVFHLLLNMYALIYIGILLEPHLGKTRFLAAYLISGIAASVTSLWWHDFTVSAGASGAIFGMYGVFIALLTANILEKSAKKALLGSTIFFVGYNILNGLKQGSGIDNAAHIGGLVTGLIVGYAFLPSIENREDSKLRNLIILALSTFLLIGSAYIFNSLPNDVKRYEEKMEKFVAMEAMAMEVFSYHPYTPKEIIISELENRGIYYWKENLKLINSFNGLSLPQQIKDRNAKLKEYCELRIKSFELIRKALIEGTEKYWDEINSYGKKIDKIVEEIIGK